MDEIHVASHGIIQWRHAAPSPRVTVFCICGLRISLLHILKTVVGQILLSFSGSVTSAEENPTDVCLKDFIYKPKSCLQSPTAPMPQGLYGNTSAGLAVTGDASLPSALTGILPRMSSSWLTLLSIKISKITGWKKTGLLHRKHKGLYCVWPVC